MNRKNSLIAVGLGFVFIVVSILGDILNRLAISPWKGEYLGHLVSVLLSLCSIYVLTYLFMRRLKHRRRGHIFRRYRKDLIFFGALWFAMSFLAEIIQQYIVNDPTESVTWTNYNILKGRLMGIVLLSELIAPFLFGAAMLKYREYQRDRGGRR